MSNRKRVLVVDDDTEVRTALCETIRDFGYEVVPAVHGRDALNAMEELPERPGLVLLDMIMPVMNGQEFCAELIRRGEIDLVPVVVLAGLRGFQCQGARRYIRKPIDLDTLIQVVAEHCGS